MAIDVGEASGTGARDAATALLDQLAERQGVRSRTLGADKSYEAGECYLDLERRGVEPRVAVIEKAPADAGRVRADRWEAFEARRRMKARLSTATYGVSRAVGRRSRNASAG